MEPRRERWVCCPRVLPGPNCREGLMASVLLLHLRLEALLSLASGTSEHGLQLHQQDGCPPARGLGAQATSAVGTAGCLRSPESPCCPC